TPAPSPRPAHGRAPPRRAPPQPSGWSRASRTLQAAWPGSPADRSPTIRRRAGRLPSGGYATTAVLSKCRFVTWLERQLEEDDVGDRMVPVRRDLAEAERAIELLCRDHRPMRVEPEARVAGRARDSDQLLHERTSEAEP